MKANWGDLPKVNDGRGHTDLIQRSVSVYSPNLPLSVSKMHKGFSTYTESGGRSRATFLVLILRVNSIS